MVKLNKLPEQSINEKNGGIEVSVPASNQEGNQVVNYGLVKGLAKGLAKELVKGLTENQKKLLELIEANPNVTKVEMAK